MTIDPKGQLIGDLREDVLNGSSGFLSDNKACYRSLTGFTALLEINYHMLLEMSYNRQIMFNTTQSSNTVM